MTYTAADTMVTNAAYDTATNIKNNLKYSMTTAHADPLANNGVIVNLDVLGNLKSQSNEVKLYMWIINDSATTPTLKIKGCAASPCATVTDFTVEVGGGSAFTANKVIIQEISLVKNAGGTIKVTANGNTADAKDLYHDAALNKLWVQFTFVTEVKLKLGYFQINISKHLLNINFSRKT